MCRLLCVKSETHFPISHYLKELAHISKNSQEFQGHGWGYALYNESKWELYHKIKPIWEDSLDVAPEGTILLAHARSAFENKNIKVENNMPFQSGNYAYIFNGELRGVRIHEQGRIGAEKLFNFIKRFDNGSIKEAMSTGLAQIEKRTKYIKAFNMIVANDSHVHLVSRFNENPAYYTLHKKSENGMTVISSEPFGDISNWSEIPQGVHQV